MTGIKLYPTPEAMLLIRAAYEQHRITRQKSGLRPLSLSQYLTEMALAAIAAGV